MKTAADVRVDPLSLARYYADHPEQWLSALRYDPDHRWYLRLDERYGHEVWLLSWLPGQGTELHDHGGSAGAFTVVSGTLTETTVTRGDRADRLHDTALAAGTGRRFGAHHVHRVHNHGTEPAISVHVYGPALKIMTRYEISAGRLLATGVDRAGTQW